MKRILVLSFLFIVSPLFAFGAGAEEIGGNRHEVDEVVITATRTERKTEEIPAGVGVVTEETLKDSRLLGVKEALSGLAGVLSESRNGGYDSRLIIRGAGLKARYGVREIMVMLDGVPITDPDGLTRLDFVDTQLIERVDVVKGPNSTLYGANASGGVINIITKSPYEGIRNAKVGYGSDRAQLYNLIYGTNIGETYLTLTGTRKSTDGWRAWNEFQSNQAGIKVGRLLPDNTSLEWNFNYTEADIQLPGTLSQEQFDQDITQLTEEPFRHSSRDSRIYFTNLKAEKQVGSLKFTPLVYFQKWDHFHPVPGRINEGGAEIYGTDVQVDLAHSPFGIQSLLTAGVTAQIDKSESEKYTYRDVETLFNPFSPRRAGRITATLSDRKGELAEIDDGTVIKWGVFLQESLRPTDRWIVDLGIRFDQVLFDESSEVYKEYDYRAGRYIVPDRQSLDVDKTFENISPRLGVIFKASPIFSLYGNVSSGFQTPQSSELMDNNDLDPAKTINYEIGVKARFVGGHSFDLSLFYMNITDEIVQTLLAGGDTSFSNAGESVRKGAEISARFQPLEGLFLGGTYTYSDFKYENFDEPIGGVLLNRDDNRLPYIPEHQYSLYVDFKSPSGFKFKLNTYTWGEYYVDNANSEEYKGYDLLTSAVIGWENPRWNVTLDVQNLFDKHYAMEVDKDTMGDLRFRPGAPRTFFGKISYSF